MSTKSHHKTYWLVFGALAVLTILTVGVSNLHLGIATAIAVAMIIAFTKGSLVGAYFMHLVGEHKLIFFLLILTLIFFIVLLFVPFFVSLDDYRISVGQP